MLQERLCLCVGLVEKEKEKEKERHRQKHHVQIALSSIISSNPKLPTFRSTVNKKMCVVRACVYKKKRQSSKTVPLQRSNVLHMWAGTLQCSYNCEEQKDRNVRVAEHSLP